MNTTTKEPKSSAWLHYRKRLRFNIFRRDRFRCQYCGRSVADGALLTLEHVHPKSKGGELSKDNLLTACHDCNGGKWDDVLNGFELKELKKVWFTMRPPPSIIVVA